MGGLSGYRGLISKPAPEVDQTDRFFPGTHRKKEGKIKANKDGKGAAGRCPWKSLFERFPGK